VAIELILYEIDDVLLLLLFLRKFCEQKKKRVNDTIYCKDQNAKMPQDIPLSI
jgi:hypothetical protein